MIYAKLSTAITILFGPVLDSTGAEYTGAVVAEVKISKNNGTPAALNASATLTHKEVGNYELVLTTSDISAVGQATLTLSKTTYVAPPVHLVVLPAQVYDSLIGGTDLLDASAAQFAGQTITAAAGVTVLASVGTAATNTAQTGDSFAVVKSGGAGDNAAIKTQTDKLAFTVTNKVDANVYTWNGTAVATPAAAGVPEVNVKAINNVATTPVTTVKAVQGLTTADTVTAGTVSDKTGYAIGTGGIAAAAFAAGAIDAAAIAANAIGASEIADGAIDNATLAADVEVKSNVKKINDTALTGNGSTIPWGPA